MNLTRSHEITTYIGSVFEVRFLTYIIWENGFNGAIPLCGKNHTSYVVHCTLLRLSFFGSDLFSSLFQLKAVLYEFIDVTY